MYILKSFSVFVNCFIDFHRCKAVSPNDMRKNETKLRVHNGGLREIFHVSSCEMFTVCDVMHDTKQKT